MEYQKTSTKHKMMAIIHDKQMPTQLREQVYAEPILRIVTTHQLSERIFSSVRGMSILHEMDP